MLIMATKCYYLVVLHVSSGTHIKSGTSSFNTGKQHVNSGSMYVNSGTTNKSGSSRVNTGKQHVNSGSMYVNSVIMPLKHMEHRVFFDSICDKKLNVLFTEKNVLWCSSDFKMPDENQVPTSVRSINHASYCLVITDDCSSGKLEFCGEKRLLGLWLADSVIPTTFWAESSQYCLAILQQERFKRGQYNDVQTGRAEELLVVFSLLLDKNIKRTIQPAAGSEHNATKKSLSSKKPSSTPISKSADDIMVFRKELDALALKHLGPVPTKTPTSTDHVNTGSGNLNTGNEQVSPSHIEAVAPSAHKVREMSYSDDDDEMPEIRIYDKSCEGIFEQASYDDDGVITDFNNLPDEVDVLTNPTLRIHTAILENLKPRKVTEALEGGNTKVVKNVRKIKAWFDAMQEELLQSKLQQSIKWMSRVLFCMALLMKKSMSHNLLVLLILNNPQKWVQGGSKALYGLHQAPRAWYATLSTFLEKHGYKRGTIDKTLFIRRNKKDIMLVQVYVDDIIFGSTNKSWCADFEALMQSRFQMSSMGELTFFLGLQVKQNKDGIFISQDKSNEIEDPSRTSRQTQLGLRKNPPTKGELSISWSQRLISWQCKKQTIVRHDQQTEAEYVAAAHCCGQVQLNQVADPTPSQSIPATSLSHVQIPQPPPTVTHSVQPPPQPSSVQPTAITPPTQPVQTTSPPTSSLAFLTSTNSATISLKYHHLQIVVITETELSETKQTLGTAILQLIEKVKKLENKLRKKRKREAQEEQISPSTLEAAQILTIVASEGFKGSQAPLGSKIYKRKSKSTKTPTKILHFEEPDSAQVNTAQVNTAELNPDSTPSAQINTGEVNAAEVFQAEVQASKTSKELQERLVEQEEEAAREALATEFDYIQARLNADHILAEKIQQEEREQYSMRKEQSSYMTQLLAQRSFLQNKRSAIIRNSHKQ
ncbi:putative ribonuclease H-like domain-containing protein [Tanacetum coccineum]